MTRQEQLKECRRELSNAMEEVGSGRSGIWQNNAYWWLCKAVILLLNKEIKDGG